VVGTEREELRMPRAAKKTAGDIDPDALYTAWQAGSADIDGITYSVTSGERRRGSDPLVQHHSWLFVEDGVPAVERPNAFHHVVARHEAEQAPPEHELQLAGPLPVPLEREDVIQLTRSVTVRAGHVDDRKIQTYDRGTVSPPARRSPACSRATLSSPCRISSSTAPSGRARGGRHEVRRPARPAAT
jgi:hypothetical protein